MLDFERTEMLETRSLNFLRHFSYGFFLMWFLQRRSSVLNCAVYSRTKQMYVTLFFISVTRQIKLDCGSPVVQCNRTHEDSTGGVRVTQLPLN
jgi:hypothetical protein